MAGTFNKSALKKEIFKNKEVQKLVRESVKKEIEIQKNNFLQEFNSHPVTQEIESGPNASNSSGTLGGYGNLFSFLGFSNGSNPVVPVRLLIQKIFLNKSIKITDNGFQFIVTVPSKEEFASASRLPWENGRSWLFDVEKVISGLGAYLYGKFGSSRSGSGLQSKYNYSGRLFKPTKYFNGIYNNFLRRLGSVK